MSHGIKPLPRAPLSVFTSIRDSLHEVESSGGVRGTIFLFSSTMIPITAEFQQALANSFIHNIFQEDPDQFDIQARLSDHFRKVFKG